jgi:sugar phosphate isomerase/epimerase
MLEVVFNVRSPLRSRREFLGSSAVAALACALRAPANDTQQTTLDRRQPQGLKLACSSQAFCDLKWDEAFEEVKKAGFRYAALAMFEGSSHLSPSALNDPEAHAKRIIAVTSRLEIDPIAVHANLVVGDPSQFPGLTTPDAAARKTVLAQFERIVACARFAEIPLISVTPGRLIETLTADACIKNACDVLAQMHAMAARRGLLLAAANPSGSIAQDPDETLKILERVPGLRLDYQVGHVVANQYSVEQTGSLMKHVGHVRVSNARPGEPNIAFDEGGQLGYDVRLFVESFLREKVNAHVSLECAKPSDRAGIPRLKEILEGAGVSAS